MTIPHIKRVLVIDDDDQVLVATARLLRMAGYEVVTRPSAFGTLAAVMKERPDVVLLDLNMPLISGDRLAELVLEANRDPPVVIIHSGLTDEIVRERAAKCGAHGFIIKGASPAAFIDTFKRIIATQSATSSKTP